MVIAEVEVGILIKDIANIILIANKVVFIHINLVEVANITEEANFNCSIRLVEVIGITVEEALAINYYSVEVIIMLAVKSVIVIAIIMDPSTMNFLKEDPLNS
jgi:hypothetical protein